MKCSFEEAVRIGKFYGATVRRDTENCSPNHGASSGKDIWLGEFDDPEIEMVAFFHELGHVMSSTVNLRGYTMCKMSSEGLAWELGLSIAYEHDYVWAYDSKPMKWAREQMLSYMTSDVTLSVLGDEHPMSVERLKRAVIDAEFCPSVCEDSGQAEWSVGEAQEMAKRMHYLLKRYGK